MMTFGPTNRTAIAIEPTGDGGLRLVTAPVPPHAVQQSGPARRHPEPRAAAAPSRERPVTPVWLVEAEGESGVLRFTPGFLDVEALPGERRGPVYHLEGADGAIQIHSTDREH